MSLLLMVLLSQVSNPADLQRSFAVGSKDAVLMAPPETVCGSEALRLQWTAGGRNLVVQRRVTDPSAADLALTLGGAPSRTPPKFEIVVWNLQSHRGKTVLTYLIEGTTIETIEPIPSTENVVVQLSERRRVPGGNTFAESKTIGVLSADAGTFVPISSSGDNGQYFETFAVSPNRPIIALQQIRFDGKATAVRFIVNGRAGSPFTLPPKAALHYDAAGMPGYIVAPIRVPGVKPRLQVHRIDPLTGRELSVVDFNPKPGAEEPVPPMKAMSIPSIAQAPVVAPAVLLKVEGGKSGDEGIVSTDGVYPELSPKSDAIAYISQGSAMVRGLARVPRLVYDQAKIEAEKRIAMSNAKQLGLGLLMYSADMDDVLPGKDSDINQIISPYLRNNSLYQGFTYTFGGGNMSGIENPAEATLGYVTGPGGRAMIYADGHVRWVPDQP